MQNGFAFLKKGVVNPRGVLPVPNYTPSPTGGGGSGGGDLISTNNLSDVADAATARANLGIVGGLSATGLIGGGGNPSPVFAHGLGTARLVPVVIKVSTGKIIDVDVVITTTTATVNFSVAPALNEYRITLVG